MPDIKITSLVAASSVYADDLLLMVDVHDPSMAPTGTDKKVSVSQLAAAMVTIQGGAVGRFLTVGDACSIDTVNIETGCIAAGTNSEVADTTGQGGADWSFALGAYNRAQGCAGLVVGSHGLAYSQNQLVVGGGTFGAGTVVGPGDAQLVTQPLIGQSTSGSPVTLRASGPGGPGNTVVRPIVRAGRTCGCTITVVGRKSGGSAHAMFVRRAIVHNEVGTTTLEGPVQAIGADINAPGWSVSVTADDTLDALAVAVTGEAGVNWAARLDWVEVG